MYEESKMTDVLMNDLFTKSHICMYNPCEENKRKLWQIFELFWIPAA